MGLLEEAPMNSQVGLTRDSHAFYEGPLGLAWQELTGHFADFAISSFLSSFTPYPA